jgi:hypothetical protein
MIRRTLALLAALVGLCASTPALAWWEWGHETVATIAWDNVKPGTRRAISALLAQAPRLGTPTCPARTIQQASIWPDCIKGLKDRFNYANNWHYQNVNICKPFDVKAACPDGNCVSSQIERDVRLLKDRKVPVTERVQALMFLVHFVGDLHQPLHAGDHGDLGGNQVKARYGIYATDRLNLHSVWDGLLAERAISTPPALTRHYSDAERATMAAGTVTDWSQESWQIARDYVYPTVLANPCGPTPKERVTLSNDKIDMLVPIVRTQIERGGLRLARLLDEALE